MLYYDHALEFDLHYYQYSKDYLSIVQWSADEEKYFYEVVVRNQKELRYYNKESLWGFENPACAKEMTFLYAKSVNEKQRASRLKGYYHEYLLEFNMNILNRNHRFYGGLNTKESFDYDLFFTPNTYQVGSTRPLMNDLFNVYCIALDVDYRDHGTGNANAAPEDYYWNCISPLCGSIIPTPNYIECSHQLRLIYVLSEPVYAKSRKMMNTTKIALKRLSDALNNELDCGCEPQKLSSYFRMPHSKNTKDGSIVHVHHITSVRWAVQELMDEFLPELPDWYGSWVSNKKGKKVQLRNHFTLWSHRLAAIQEVQGEEGINRENTAFLYAQYLMWTHSDWSDEEIMESVLEFNQQFTTPLREKELRSKLGSVIRGRKLYKFKTQTLNEFVGIDLGIQDRRTRDEERDQRIAAGDMRWQKTDAKAMEVQRLKAEGKTNKEIAASLGCTVRMVQKLNKRKIEQEKEGV